MLSPAIGIKNIQRVALTIPANSQSGSAVITAVNMAKTVLNMIGNAAQVGYGIGCVATGLLQNSTTIFAVVAVPNPSYPQTINFEVIEYF